MSISIICSCKNRNKALSISLSSWINLPEIQEIIIVDWSSDENLEHILFLDQRIKLIRVNNQKHFNQIQPLNLAASLVKSELILKLDSDYIINPYYDFVNKYKPSKGHFSSGNSSEKIEGKANSFYAFLRGLLFVYKEDFDLVGGYNESLKDNYAYEDEDICARLVKLGLQEKYIDFDFHLIHIPHPDKKRTEHFIGNAVTQEMIDLLNSNLSKYYSAEEFEYQKDYVIKEIQQSHNKKRTEQTHSHFVKQETKWKLFNITDRYFVAEQIHHE